MSTEKAGSNGKCALRGKTVLILEKKTLEEFVLRYIKQHYAHPAGYDTTIVDSTCEDWTIYITERTEAEIPDKGITREQETLARLNHPV